MPELQCPEDRKNPLTLDSAACDFSKSFNGVISCKDGHEFRIDRNVVDFLPDKSFPGGSLANFSNHFSITASTYEQQWRKRSIGWLSGQDFTLEEEADLLLKWIDPFPKKKVIDIGASTGFYSRTVASAYPESEVYAIDFSRPMLDETITRAAQDKIRLYALRADAARLPFFEEQVDVVLCGGTYNELSDPETALHEMYRVLKPGGVCFIMYLTKAASIAGKLFQSGLSTGGVAFPKQKKTEKLFKDTGFEFLKTRSMGIVTFQLLGKK